MGRRRALGHLLLVTTWPMHTLGMHVLLWVILRVTLLRVHIARSICIGVALEVIRRKAPSHRMLSLWVLSSERLCLVVCIGG